MGERGMLLLVFFVAVLNLAVGYALGAGLSLASLLDLLPRRTKKPETGDISDDEELTRPAPDAPAKQATAPEPAAPAKKKTPKPKPSPAEVMASLKAFQADLSTASTELKDNAQDEAEFGASANKLQEVNHAYLEEAEGAIQHLDELGAAGDRLASATSEAVAKGAEEVAQISGELDSLIEGGLSEQAARDQLLKTTDRLADATESAKQAASEAMEAADTPPTASPMRPSRRSRLRARRWRQLTPRRPTPTPPRHRHRSIERSTRSRRSSRVWKQPSPAPSPNRRTTWPRSGSIRLPTTRTTPR